MKRSLFTVVILLFIFFISGCQEDKTEIINPVQLYFCRTDVAFQAADGLIAPEQREFSGWENQTLDFLNEYLKGPVSPELTSPFPSGGWIVELSKSDASVDIVLSINFTRLSPNELTTACACISLTVFELLDAETVNFAITSIDSEDYNITMSRKTLLLSENEVIN